MHRVFRRYRLYRRRTITRWTGTTLLAVALAALTALPGCGADAGPNTASRSEAVLFGECDSTVDCPRGQECLFNRCVTPPPAGICMSDADCGPNEVCLAKKCQPGSVTFPIGECTADSDCLSYMHCDIIKHKCVVDSGRCVNQNNCPLGYNCNSSHYCVKAPNYCDAHTDCVWGQMCSAKRCGCGSGGCTLGAGRCNGRTPELCTAYPHGCNLWARGSTCPQGTVCDDGSCDACRNDCSRAGQERKFCLNDYFLQREICTKDSDGCLYWYRPAAILCGGNGSYGSCVNNACFIP